MTTRIWTSQIAAVVGNTAVAKMLGRLGWRGQCSCCNGPKDVKAIRAEEKVQFRRLSVEEAAEYTLKSGTVLTPELEADLVAEAEGGYDVERLNPRLPKPHPLAVAQDPGRSACSP